MKTSVSAASKGTGRARRSAACLCVIQFLAVLLCPRPAPAAFEISWPDARSAGMLVRGTDLFPPMDAGSFRSSSGTATGTATGSGTEPGARTGPRVTISAGELYGISEAAGWGARAAARFRGVSLRVELTTLGGELYQERSLGLEVGLDPDPDLHLVARVRVLGLGARGVDDRWAAAVDVSATRRLIGRVFLGAGCDNLTRSRIGDSPVASRARFGAALLLPSVTLRWTLSFEEPFAASTALGFEAALTDWLRVRAGAMDAPGKLGFGIGVGRPRARPWPLIDLAWQWHPELGVSSFVSITMQL